MKVLAEIEIALYDIKGTVAGRLPGLRLPRRLYDSERLAPVWFATSRVPGQIDHGGARRRPARKLDSGSRSSTTSQAAGFQAIKTKLLVKGLTTRVAPQALRRDDRTGSMPPSHTFGALASGRPTNMGSCSTRQELPPRRAHRAGPGDWSRSTVLSSRREGFDPDALRTRGGGRGTSR